MKTGSKNKGRNHKSRGNNGVIESNEAEDADEALKVCIGLLDVAQSDVLLENASSDH